LQEAVEHLVVLSLVVVAQVDIAQALAHQAVEDQLRALYLFQQLLTQ
jgi:hypothetical protein